MEQNQFKCKLVGQKMLTPSVLQLTFERMDGCPLVFLPGQFITFLLPHANGQYVRRSYSLSNSPQASATFDVTIAPVAGGFATNILFQLNLGDELLATGPAGRLVLHETETPTQYLFVATGTGIAPYRSMLPTLAQRLEAHQTMKATILLGVRHTEDILYAADFLSFAEKYNRFCFRAYLSREPAPTLPYQHMGYVQTAFCTLNLNPTTDLVYLCGNPQMIDTSITQLKAMGFGSTALRLEKYTSKKVATP